MKSVKGLIKPLCWAVAGATFGGTAAAEDYFLEEVVVTAQKRAQSAQDLGVAIMAVSGESLREQGINNGNDLARIVPNFSLTEVAGLTVPIVRGVGLQNFRINDSPTTSFYLDEVYQTSVAAAAFSMFDLERVEVLKGPQGGLYGRNSIAAAIQVISVKPDINEAANGEVNVGVGSFGSRETEFGFGFPLSDRAAMRVAGRWEKSDEGASHIPSTDTDYGAKDRWAGRVQLRYQPNDELDLLFKIHGGSDDSELPLLRSVGLYTDIGTAAGIGAPGLSLGLLGGLLAPGAPGTGLCASILAGNGSDSQTCATVTGATPADLGQGGSSGNDRFAADNPSLAPRLENDWLGASAIATLELGDYTLTSVSSFDTLDYHRLTDFDATQMQSQDTDYASKIDFWAQEFRLAYEGSDSVSWLVGLNYAEDELQEDSWLHGADGVLPIFYGGAVSSSQKYTQKTEALAVFGHAEWQLAERWRGIGELRYTDADKSIEGEQLMVLGDGSVAPFFSADDSTSFQSLSGKVGLEFTPSNDVLLYGSVSRGFKTGGFFGGFATTTDALEAYDEETILAYEAGIKSDWLDHKLRVNASVFFYDRSDVQQSASNPSGSTRVARLTNIGDVESTGAEMDISWLPTSSLLFNLSLGYTDTEVVDSDFVSVSAVTFLPEGSLEGVNVPNYSKFSANFSGRYQRALTDSLLASVQLEYSYRSEKDLALILNPEIENALFKEPSYGLFNLRVALFDADEKWRVSLFAENLTDEEYRIEAGSDGLFGLRERYGEPRTWGASVNYSWD